MGVVKVRVPLHAFSDPNAKRREQREPLVRRVEFCRFPRVCADQRQRVGFTRDISRSGLCLRTEQPEPVGSLLRLVVRGVDGEPQPAALARVAWTRRDEDGSHWMGLAQLASRADAPMRIQYVRRPHQVEVA